MDYEVAIIGGGYCGLWTSVYLSEFGVNNVVLTANGLHSDEPEEYGTKEKSAPSTITAASRLNCGLIMPSGPGSRKANFYVETWQQVLKRQAQVDWQPRPVLEVATNDEEFQFGQQWLEKAKTNAEWLKLMTKEQIHEIEPRITTNGGVVFCKSGTINPTKLLTCLETEADHIKSNFIIDTITKRGFFTIKSTTGSTIKAKKLVLALGAGTRQFARDKLDLELKVHAVRGTMWSTSDTRNLEPLRFNLCSLRSALFYAKKDHSLLPSTTNKNGAQPKTSHLYSQLTPSGDFICGGEREEISGSLVQEQNQQRANALELNKKFVTSIWPELKQCQIQRSWTGLMPWTVDGNPMIGPFVDGVHVNTGLQSAGLMMGAGASKYCAEMVVADLRGQSVHVDSFCDPTRFNIKGTQF